MSLSSDNGSLAPQTLLMLFFISIIAIAASRIASHVILAEQRALARIELRERMVAMRDSVLEDLTEDASPEADTRRDPIWAWDGKTEGDLSVSIRSLSSSLNPNFVRKELLDRTDLENLLLPGKTPDDLQQWREDNGLSLTHDGYSDFFSRPDFDQYLSCYGWMNINVVDEFAARTFAIDITGSEAAGDGLRDRVRNILTTQKPIEREKLSTALGSLYDDLYPFVNAEPLYNVNFIEPFILEQILSYKEYKVKNPLGIAKSILSARDSDGLTPEQLRGILGIDKTHRLFYLLGTTTWFWEIRIQSPHEELITVVCRLPPSNTSPNDKPIFNMIETRFEK